MRNAIKATSLIALVAVAVLAVSVATASEARAQVLIPNIPYGGFQPVPPPAPNNSVQIAPIDCNGIVDCLQPNIGNNIELAPNPNPNPNPNPGSSAGSTGGSGSPSGSGNVAGATNAPAPDKSSDASLPNAGTGTGSSATGGSQSDLILVGLVIAGFAIALALFFTAWRMRRVRS